MKAKTLALNSINSKLVSMEGDIQFFENLQAKKPRGLRVSFSVPTPNGYPSTYSAGLSLSTEDIADKVKEGVASHIYELYYEISELLCDYSEIDLTPEDTKLMNKAKSICGK